MRGRWLINLLLLAVCALLLVLARWPSAPPPGLAQLAGIDPESVTRIRISPNERPVREFVAGPAGWQQSAPQSAAVSATLNQRLDALLRAPASRVLVLDGDDQAAKAQQLAGLGLAEPWLELAFDHIPLSAGGAEPIGRRRYLRAGEQILLIDDRWLLPLLTTP
jgi:hypothetical protein